MNFAPSRLTRAFAAVAIVASLAAVAAAGRAAGAANPNPFVAPPGSTPYGMSYADWSAAWWKWSLALPVSTNPGFAEGAVDCGSAQSTHPSSRQVWFLTGVFNASGVVSRSCAVPAGTALFLPVINVECSTLEGAPFHGGTDAELRSCAEQFGMTGLQASVDGVPVRSLGSYTFESPAYDFTVPDDNLLGVPAGSGRSVANGVYLMIWPLPAGAHTIHFGGTFPDFGFTLDITYHIQVGGT